MNDKFHEIMTPRMFYGCIYHKDGEIGFQLVPRLVYEGLRERKIPGTFSTLAYSEDEIDISGVLAEIADREEKEREVRLATMPLQDFYLEATLEDDGTPAVTWITPEEYRIKLRQGKFVFHEFAPTKDDVDIFSICSNLKRPTPSNSNH